jgi:serine/threonine protein kinase
VADFENRFRSSVWDGISEDATVFIDILLLVDPRQRVTARDALKHEWFASLIPSDKKREHVGGTVVDTSVPGL